MLKKRARLALLIGRLVTDGMTDEQMNELVKDPEKMRACPAGLKSPPALSAAGAGAPFDESLTPMPSHPPQVWASLAKSLTHDLEPATAATMDSGRAAVVPTGGAHYDGDLESVAGQLA